MSGEPLPDTSTEAVHVRKPPAGYRLMSGSLNELDFVNEGHDPLLLENAVGSENRSQQSISSVALFRLFFLQMT